MLELAKSRRKVLHGLLIHSGALLVEAQQHNAPLLCRKPAADARARAIAPGVERAALRVSDLLRMPGQPALRHELARARPDRGVAMDGADHRLRAPNDLCSLPRGVLASARPHRELLRQAVQVRQPCQVREGWDARPAECIHLLVHGSL